jgi:glucose/arabinose dehydrogenase
MMSISRLRPGHALAFALLCTSALAVAGCDDDDDFDPNTQIGANPNLPALKQYLFPPMHIASVVGWKEGEAPAVASGLQVEALATGLEHPRVPYVLPNGDILIVESRAPPAQSIKRPKDLIMGWIESWATSGGKSGGSNRITLLHQPGDKGGAMTRSVFLDHLNSPFGVALVGDDLYVADTDAIIRYPYHGRGDKHDGAGHRPDADLPGGPIDHHWTKSLVASKDGAQALCRRRFQQQHHRKRHRRPKRTAPRSGRWTGQPAASRIFAGGLRNPNGLSWEPETGALWVAVNERDELGNDLVPDYMTSVKDGGFYGWPYSYYGQHVDVRVEPQRPDLVAKAIAPDYALSSHVAPLGLAFYTATGGLPDRLSRRGVRRRAWQLEPSEAERLQGHLRPVQRRSPERHAGRRRDRVSERRQRGARAAGRAGDRQIGWVAHRRRRRKHGLAVLAKDLPDERSELSVQRSATTPPNSPDARVNSAERFSNAPAKRPMRSGKPLVDSH